MSALTDEHLAPEDQQRLQETGCVMPTGCAHKNERHGWLCNSSCEQAHARALVNNWKAQDEERATRGKYLGCPVCKQRVRFTCYHDGQDIPTVELDLPVPEWVEHG